MYNSNAGTWILTKNRVKVKLDRKNSTTCTKMTRKKIQQKAMFITGFDSLHKAKNKTATYILIIFSIQKKNFITCFVPQNKLL